MPLDFLQVRDQVKTMGENAQKRLEKVAALRDTAASLLGSWAGEQDALRDKLHKAAQLNERLRCALPTTEPLTAAFDCPPSPANALVIAADGSQINPDWHSEVSYGLVNIGAIAMRTNTPDAPTPQIFSQMFLEDQLYIENSSLNDTLIAMLRDQRERSVLADLAEQAGEAAITITDGPIELWRATELAGVYQSQFELYLQALHKLRNVGATTAGYVDKPRSDLIVRMLEIAQLSDGDLDKAGKERPFAGVRDTDLFTVSLLPGQRSAVFAIQSRSARDYPDALALHLFYLNVTDRADQPWITRVEVPHWVASDAAKLDALHAVLVEQCRIMGSQPFPYLLHRAHETAIVTRDEKDKIDQMIMQELLSQGLAIAAKSPKQFHKDNV